MAMALGPVRDRLATVLSGVSGVKRAHKYTPRALRSANCPQWLIQPGGAEYMLDFWDGDYAVYRTVREWRLILLLGKAGQGVYGTLEDDLWPYFDRVEDEIAADLKLDGLDGVVRTYLVEDAGPTTVPFPRGSNVIWFGVEWGLAVESRQDIYLPSSLASNGSTVRTRTAAALERVDGVKTVYAYTPRDAKGMQAPAFMVIGDEAEHGAAWVDGHDAGRVWRLQLLAGSLGAGVYGDLEKGLDPFFEEAPKTLGGYVTLNDLSNVVNGYLVSDTGPGVIEFPPGSGSEWLGCEWEWYVQEKRSVTRGL